jgi:hypothetical protein
MNQLSYRWLCVVSCSFSVLNVKLLQAKPGLDARAAFIDFETVEIATTAHEAENRIGDQTLRTDYNNRGQPRY